MSASEISIVPVVGKRDAQQKFISVKFENLRVLAVEIGGSCDDNHATDDCHYDNTDDNTDDNHDDNTDDNHHYVNDHVKYDHASNDDADNNAYFDANDLSHHVAHLAHNLYSVPAGL